MAVAFRSATSTNSTTSSITLTKPTGTAENDILLVMLYTYHDYVVPEVTPPDVNWTTQATIDYGGGPFRRWTLLWKRAGGSEGSDYTFTVPGSSTTYSNKGPIGAYSGCVTSGSPIDQCSSTSDAGTSETTVTAATITPTVSPSLAVWAGGGSTSLTSATIDNGFTEDHEGSSGAILSYLGSKSLADTSAVGNTTVTGGSASANKSAFLLNLHATAGGGSTYPVWRSMGAGVGVGIT